MWYRVNMPTSMNDDHCHTHLVYKAILEHMACLVYMYTCYKGISRGVALLCVDSSSLQKERVTWRRCDVCLPHIQLPWYVVMEGMLNHRSVNNVCVRVCVCVCVCV